jgi:phospholipase C
LTEPGESDVPQPVYTRRRFLGGAAAVLGGATASLALPPALRAALADTPPPTSPPSIGDIEHIVVVMQENRSFDHYFGAMSGVRGFSDPDALILPNGQSVFHQPDPKNPDGYLLPWHLDTSTTNAQGMPTTAHVWEAQHDSWNNGRMDNWVRTHRAYDGDTNGVFTMGYYTRDDIPFQYALADNFTVCDNYFSSEMGPTHPNRIYLMSGMVDPLGRGGGFSVDNNGSFFKWTTYPERLQAAGVSWKVYAQSDDYGCNELKYFSAFQGLATSNPLYQNGIAPIAAGQFENDCASGTIPTVSWIIPTTVGSEHPTDSTAANGAAWVAGKLDALAANQDLWSKTVFILTYDENDGLFDHVPPPVPPRGTPNEYLDGYQVGPGFRVPTIIVSPWTAGGYVCSEQFDHTSILRLMELVTGVQEPNISAWRRQTFGDLSSVFRFDQPAAGFPADDRLTTSTVNARTSNVSLDKTYPAPVAPVPQSIPVQPSNPARTRVPS